MTGITHRFRRIYEKWKQDTLSQSDFRPSVSILKLSFMAIFVGIAAALVAAHRAKLPAPEELLAHGFALGFVALALLLL